MAFQVHSSELSRFGYSLEATWGTPIADAGAFKEVFFPKGIRIDPAVTKEDLDLNRSSRIQHLDDIFPDTFSGPVLISADEMIVTKDRVADFLFAVTQNRVSQGAATAYQKVFKMNSSQPDFTADAGMFFTLGWRGPVTAKHIKITSCIVRKLSIELDKSSPGISNLVRFRNVEIIGKKLAQGSTFSGTWTAADGTLRFNPHAFTYTDVTDGTALPFHRCLITLDNGAEPLDRDTDGTPKTFFLNPPKLGAVMVEATHWYNADTTGTVRDFIAGLIANTQVNSKIETGSTGVDGFFSFDWKGVIDGNPQGEEDRKMIVPVKWICGDTGSAEDAITITIADSIEQT